MSISMKNKVAIVTGGGSGIGRAASLIYAREGAKVVIGDVNVEGGNAGQTISVDGGQTAA